jgi:hypothetical protein
MEKSMLSVLVVANAGGGRCCHVALIPLLLMTSAQVFFAGWVVSFSWWVFFPLPPVFIFGVLLVVIATGSLSAFIFLLFCYASFPSMVFHPSFTARAVVVVASGGLVS